jgi:hypothetical protein
VSQKCNLNEGKGHFATGKRALFVKTWVGALAPMPPPPGSYAPVDVKNPYTQQGISNPQVQCLAE